MKPLQIATIALFVGSALGYGANQLLNNHSMQSMSGSLASQQHNENNSDSNEPLYWVAPMDPNYQRDKPGLSPMGMDLVPVYAEDLSGTNEPAGTITIDPSVENNLGVKTASVQLAKLSPRIETVGYIAFDESRLWQTNVRVAGWVEKLNINAVGEQVKKGDVLFTLYSPELIKAQEELLNAYRTSRQGLIKGATERLLTLGVDRSQIKQIRKQGKASQTINIKAIDDGVIASLNIREGGYLSPSQAVISAGPLDEVWVDAEVFERQAHWIESGSFAEMTLDAVPGKSWKGEVDYVYPILDPKTRTIRMRLKFSNSEGQLKPNMFANIALQPVTEGFALTIPKSAVIRSGGMSRVVLSEGNGKYRSARIEIGREAGSDIEVIQGLTEQDRVVTSAHFMLDSESSQSADLSRINGVEAIEPTVWAKGQITDLMKGHKMATINHEPVPEWEWPGMVMNFNFADNVNIDYLEKGQLIDFEMLKSESGQYEIVDFKIDTAKAITDVWLTGNISMLMPDFGMITLQHAPVSEWNWEAGEMNFSVDSAIDLAPYQEGQKVRFLVSQSGSEYSLEQLESIVVNDPESI